MELYRIVYRDGIYHQLSNRILDEIEIQMRRIHKQRIKVTAIDYLLKEISILTSEEIAEQIRRHPNVEDVKHIPKRELI